MKKTAITFLLALSTLGAFSQEAKDFSWLTGTWTGEGFGGTFEEIWSEPATDGTIIGMFRHFGSDGSLVFYEFWALDSTGMKLKHFNPDFTGWESKEDYIDFEMVESAPGKVILNGLSYEQTSDDTMVISLRMKYKEEVKTEVFNMKRLQ